MKKILFIIIFIFGMMCTIKTVALSFDFSKVTYETKESYKTLLATEDDNVNLANGKIIVRVELKLEDAYSQFVCDIHNKTFKENNNQASYQTKTSQYNNLTLNQAKKNKEKNNAILKAYHQNKNKAIDQSLRISGYEEKYVGDYSPYIEYIFKKSYFLRHQNQILKNLSASIDVKNVYVIDYDAYEEEPMLNTAAGDTGIYDIYMNREYTGDGIYIGIIDVGTINKNHTLLQNVNCEIYKEAEYGNTYVREHATQMAIAIAGYKGIAPDAEVKSAAMIGSIMDELEWMVAKGVDIINMSFGESNPQGVYNSTSAYVDYIAYTYGIIMVASVGNSDNGNTNVCNPGLSYNAISLGASNFTNTAVIDISSYTFANDQQPFKPTLCIDGKDVTIGGAISATGTSISAAITTGNIALLLEIFPSLVGDPRSVIALLVANANPYSQNRHPFVAETAMAIRAGAGRLYTRGVIDNINNLICFNNSTGQINTNIYTQNINLNADETLRVSIAWLAKTNGTTSNVVKGDYDIYLQTLDGQVLASSTSKRSIVEIMTYRATESGTYKVVVKQCSDRIDAVDAISMAYQITN